MSQPTPAQPRPKTVSVRVTSIALMLSFAVLTGVVALVTGLSDVTFRTKRSGIVPDTVNCGSAWNVDLSKIGDRSADLLGCQVNMLMPTILSVALLMATIVTAAAAVFMIFAHRSSR